MLHARPSTAWVQAVDDKLMRWFDITTYVILEPNSYSRRILNDQVTYLGAGMNISMTACLHATQLTAMKLVLCSHAWHAYTVRLLYANC